MPKRHFILPEGACGERITKGNIVPLSSLEGSGTMRKVPEFFATFFQKKLGRGLFFAEKHLGVGEYPYSLTDVFAERRKFVFLNFRELEFRALSLDFPPFLCYIK